MTEAEIRKMKWTMEDFKNSKDIVDRTVWLIATLSPHNLWKGSEAINNLFKSERERLVREVEGLGYYKVKLFDGFMVGEKKSKVLLRKEVLKIIQANKEEEKEKG